MPVAALVAVTLACITATGALAHPFHPGADTPDLTTTGYRLDRVGTYDYPTYVTAPPGDRARHFVVEQDGQIRVNRNGSTLSRPFLDVARLIDFDQGERGLLSMAFARDYASSRIFYIFYTDREGDLRVDELKRSTSSAEVADPGSRRRVIEIGHSARSNHNGGQLQVGPGGFLFVSTGDGGGGGDPDRNGQNRESLLGKILRIDPRRRSGGRGYSVPSSNPFVGSAGRDEIWHYGLRNPWRFSFDRSTFDMAIGDVGQSRMEEVDFVARPRRGLNFGWNCFEGRLRYSGCSAPGHVPPAIQYAHGDGSSNASCSVTGGYVVRDPAMPRLAGYYLYGDYCTGALHGAVVRDGQATPANQNHTMGLIVPRLTSFGEDAQGRIYATSRSYEGRAGAVYRLRATR